MSVRSEKKTVEASYIASITCDRCGAETVRKIRPPYGSHDLPRAESESAGFNMWAREGWPIDSLYFDLSGDLCLDCTKSFIEWFNDGDGPGWEKGKTWDEIVGDSWA